MIELGSKCPLEDRASHVWSPALSPPPGEVGCLQPYSPDPFEFVTVQRPVECKIELHLCLITTSSYCFLTSPSS